jgi:hypothetical protein
MLLEPFDRTRDAFLERHRRLVAEELASLRQVGDIVRDLPEKRRGECDLWLHTELAGDQLGCMHERVAPTVGEVDRFVHDATFAQRLDAARDPFDAVVHVGEVERLLLSEHGDRLVAQHRVDEQREHADHAREVVVVAPVDIREAEHEVAQAVAAGVRIDQRLTCDLRCGVRGLRIGKVGARLTGFSLGKAMHVPVDLAARREYER